MFTLALLTFLLPSASLAVNHIVTVGQNGLTYTPSSATAAIGDTVQFNYFPVNHTVTQSTFKNPCAPLVNGTVKGFSSGFVPSARE
jgi:plastocyanin